MSQSPWHEHVIWKMMEDLWCILFMSQNNVSSFWSVRLLTPTGTSFLTVSSLHTATATNSPGAKSCSFLLPIQLISTMQSEGYFPFFFFFWSVVNWINPLPSSIAIDSHFSEAVSLPQRAEPLHKLNSSCARARPKTEPQAFWNASQCVKQLSTQPACPVL